MKAVYLRERYKLISGYCGIISIILGISLFIPLLLIPFFPYSIKEAFIFIFLGAFSILMGILLRGNIKKYENITLTLQEGGTIVIISWMFSILIGALPLVLNGQLTFSQGIFESVSGFTTTGLSMVDVSETSHMILLWRSIMQFLGGAGLAVIMLAAIVGPLGVGLYNAEARSDLLKPNIKTSAKAIMIIYTGYIIGGCLLYILAGMPVFDSINHSIAAISTGGFSTQLDSIGHYNSASIELITIILMILGTINFGAHLLLLKGKFKDFFRIGEIRFMGLLLFITVPLTLYFTALPLFENFSKSMRVAVFEITSALSTTGFSTVGYSGWNSFGFFMLLLMMLVGGGSGSTAGGLKQYRIYILLKYLWWNIKKMTLPRNSIKENSVFKLEGKVFINEQHLNEIICILTIYILTFIICAFVLLAHGFSIKESFFEIASCLSTVGLSLGVTSPTLPPAVIWTMSIAMFLGRLEFLIIFSVFIKLFNDSKVHFRGITEKIRSQKIKEY